MADKKKTDKPATPPTTPSSKKKSCRWAKSVKQMTAVETKTIAALKRKAILFRNHMRKKYPDHKYTAALEVWNGTVLASTKNTGGTFSKPSGCLVINTSYGKTGEADLNSRLLHELSHSVTTRHDPLFYEAYRTFITIASRDLRWNVALTCRGCSFSDACETVCPTCTWTDALKRTSCAAITNSTAGGAAYTVLSFSQWFVCAMIRDISGKLSTSFKTPRIMTCQDVDNILDAVIAQGVGTWLASLSSVLEGSALSASAKASLQLKIASAKQPLMQAYSQTLRPPCATATTTIMSPDLSKHLARLTEALCKGVTDGVLSETGPEDDEMTPPKGGDQPKPSSNPKPPKGGDQPKPKPPPNPTSSNPKPAPKSRLKKKRRK